MTANDSSRSLPRKRLRGQAAPNSSSEPGRRDLQVVCSSNPADATSSQALRPSCSPTQPSWAPTSHAGPGSGAAGSCRRVRDVLRQRDRRLGVRLGRLRRLGADFPARSSRAVPSRAAARAASPSGAGGHNLSAAACPRDLPSASFSEAGRAVCVLSPRRADSTQHSNRSLARAKACPGERLAGAAGC